MTWKWDDNEAEAAKAAETDDFRVSLKIENEKVRLNIVAVIPSQDIDDIRKLMSQINQISDIFSYSQED